MDEHEGKRLVTESSVGRLYCYWEEYRSSRFLHIRYWYQDKKDKVWKPGKKGVAIPESRLTDLFPVLRAVLLEVTQKEPQDE